MSKPIDVGRGHDTLAQAMEAEGLFQVRWHKKLKRFTIETDDGRIGGGNTIREAIESAEAVAA